MAYKLKSDMTINGVPHKAGQLLDDIRQSNLESLIQLNHVDHVDHVDEVDAESPADTQPKRGRPRKSELTGDENDG